MNWSFTVSIPEREAFVLRGISSPSCTRHRHVRRALRLYLRHDLRELASDLGMDEEDVVALAIDHFRECLHYVERMKRCKTKVSASVSR